MNPEDASTEPLSDVFLDRFDVIYLDYPRSEKDEIEIVLRNSENFGINVSDGLLRLMVGFVRSLRSEEFEKKPGVRASISLYLRSCASARLKGKKELSLEDIAENILSVLLHRLRLKPSLRYTNKLEDYLMRKWSVFVNRARDYL